jgi:hypothetical protein
VVGDTPRDIDDEVGRVIDWIVERNLKLWQDISAYIDRRQIARHREGMIGEVGRGFSLQPAGAAGLHRPRGARGGGQLQPRGRGAQAGRGGARRVRHHDVRRRRRWGWGC